MKSYYRSFQFKPPILSYQRLHILKFITVIEAIHIRNFLWYILPDCFWCSLHFRVQSYLLLVITHPSSEIINQFQLYDMVRVNLTILLALLVLGGTWEIVDNEEGLGLVDHCKEYEETMTNCTLCDNSYYLVQTDNLCLSCSENITNCSICQNKDQTNVQCYICQGDLFPSFDFKTCGACSSIIEHCDTCEPTVSGSPTLCMNCTTDYTLSDDHKKCDSSSSPSTIIIVSAIVGGVVLIGAGFAIFKCMKKRKGTRLLEDEN